MKIVFPHIPKCAGSSVKQQIEAYEAVFLDYFNHPTWVCEIDSVAGGIAQAKLKHRLSTESKWIVFGHFCACVYDDLAYDAKAILLRDPLERAVSHYFYIQQLLPDNEVTRRRHKEVAEIKEGRMAIEEFVQLQHIRYFYSDYYLKGLTIDSRLIIGSVEHLDVSLSAISSHCRLALSNTVWLNKSRHQGDFSYLRKYFLRDTDLYNDLLSRF